MSDEKKFFFAKFLFNSATAMADGFMVSEDREKVTAWSQSDPESGDRSSEPDTSKPNEFEEIAERLEYDIGVHQRLVSNTMSMMPMFAQVQIDHSIRSYVKKHGTLLNGEDGSELYQIEITHINSLYRRVERLKGITEGIASLPEMMFVGLSSMYDNFLANLIRCIFLVRPEIISTSERNISFKELVCFGSIDEAREHILEKEIEAVIRKSHPEQIAWLENKLEMPLTKGLNIWSDFVEIFERRNLLVHTGGVISSQYMLVCKTHGVDITGRTVGQRLEIGPSYYRRSADIILEFGIKLAQVLWRKLKPDEIEKADKALNNFAYRQLARRQYLLASTILKFGLIDMKKHGSEMVRKMMVVNYANALKLGGSKDEAEKIIIAEDWSAVTDDYKICVAAVRDDTKTVVEMMGKVVASEIMKKNDFRRWPVFEKMREDAVFLEAFEANFGEKLLIEREQRTVRSKGNAIEMTLDDNKDEAGDYTMH